MSQSIGIAIPAYKNPDRLRRALNSIRELDANWLSDVSVVDDSGDGSVARVLISEYSLVTFIVHDANLGFAEAANRAVADNRCPVVVLLNDDAEMIADPRQHLARAFEDDSLFAVGLESVDETGKLREGAKRIVWTLGVARVLHNPRDQIPSDEWLKPTSYAVGGHAAYRRTLFSELGGFSEAYAPFYWEDVDLCARAFDLGYVSRALPFPCVRHTRDGAIRSSRDSSEIRRITLRNRFLFSMIHARGAQRVLQPAGLFFRKITARLSQDSVALSALREARLTYKRVNSESDA